jgi:hypothetical protein
MKEQDEGNSDSAHCVDIHPVIRAIGELTRNDEAIEGYCGGSYQYAPLRLA